MSRMELAARMATNWWKDKLMSGDKEAFAATLYPLILEELKQHGVCYLECDYDPRGFLLTAVRASGLECSGCMFSAKGILPQKHSLDISPFYLNPKEGYGNWLPEIPVEE